MKAHLEIYVRGRFHQRNKSKCWIRVDHGRVSSEKGGNITLKAGDGLSKAGNITIQAGKSDTMPGGAVRIISGESMKGNSGDLYLSSAAATGTGSSGDVHLNTGNSNKGPSGGVRIRTGSTTGEFSSGSNRCVCWYIN